MNISNQRKKRYKTQHKSLIERMSQYQHEVDLMHYKHQAQLIQLDIQAKMVRQIQKYQLEQGQITLHEYLKQEKEEIQNKLTAGCI